MQKQQHHNWQVHHFFKGANTDVVKNIVGAKDDGEYEYGRNIRPTGIFARGTTNVDAGISIVGGEEQIQINNTGVANNWMCVGATFVNGKVFEVLSNSTPGQAKIIRVDGVIVLESVLLPYEYNVPLQIDVNESVIGGEVFTTDNDNPPMIFNVQDMVDSQIAGSQKYFNDYDPDINHIVINTPSNQPIFKELVVIGGSSGLPVGYAAYSIRFGDADGNLTNGSLFTPLIAIPRAFGTGSEPFYPGVKTYGDNSNPLSNTPNGPKVRFRINNLEGYTFFEVIRVFYNAATGIDYQPAYYIIHRENIANGQFEIRDFVDPTDATVEEELTLEDQIGYLSVINRSKTLRYFNHRLYLMNVSYKSKSVEDEIVFDEWTAGNALLPFTKNLGKQGHNDPYNAAYYKRLLGGEKYGWFAVVLDSKGTRSYAVPVTGAADLEMPNRRDANGGDSLTLSGGASDSVKAATTDGQTVQVFEAFDLSNAQDKQESDKKINIFDVGSKGGVNASTVGYQPFHPVKDSDANVDDHNYRVNTDVHTGSSWQSYHPDGFGPNYFSMGVGLKGITSIPDWASAISFVRTRPAGRVIAQGIATWKMISGSGGGSNLTKSLDKMWASFPDIEAGLVDPTDIIANPGNYKIQFVSPLGFFTEMYTGAHRISDEDRGIDLVMYARMIRENGNLNPGDGPTVVGINGTDGYGYVAYGKWRNPNQSLNSAFPQMDNGNDLFSLSAFIDTSEGRGSYYELDFTQNIYEHSGAAGFTEFSDLEVRELHDPFYIVNIIDTGASVDSSERAELIDTGYFIKPKSTLGYSDGSTNQQFILVDERWEDVESESSTIDAVVWVENSFGDMEPWVDVSKKSTSAINTIISQILAGTGPYKGIYVYQFDSGTNTHSVNFTNVQFVPLPGAAIEVRYNPARPIKIFGGDAWVGEHSFAPIDKLYDENGDPNTAGDQFESRVGLPYRQFRLNDDYFVPVDATLPPVSEIQSQDEIDMGFIRQLVVMACIEARSALPLLFNNTYPDEFFPQINYVIRPQRWNTGSPYDGIYAAYQTDYSAFEKDRFGWGGIRFPQHLPNMLNTDYAQQRMDLQVIKEPTVATVDEILDFRDRVLWSAQRPHQLVNAPGVRTFPDLNFYDISDDQGAITYAWDALTTNKGQNLYAITEYGICMLLVDKRILSSKTASELSIIGADDATGVLDEYWISRGVGMPGEFWRSAAEKTRSVRGEMETLYFSDGISVFAFNDNSLKNITKEANFELGFEQGPKVYFTDDYTNKIIAAYDYENDEYLLGASNFAGVFDMAVYNFQTEKFNGYVDYIGDRMASTKGKPLLFRDAQYFELDKGDLIDGNVFEGYIVALFSPEHFADKEFIRIRINTRDGAPPEAADILKPDTLPKSETVIGSIVKTGSNNVFLNRRGYEQYLPRRTDNGNRYQNLFLRLKIRIIDTHIINAGVQYKLIK